MGLTPRAAVGLRTLLFVILGAFGAGLGAEPPDPGGEEFAHGVALYRSAEYPAALESFLAAQRSGYSDPKLDFNLGLTYYQLRRYAEASAAFTRLEQVPEYRHLAGFQLGLVAAREGDRAQATRRWRAVAQDAPQPALRERAREALSRMRASAPGPSVYLLATAGHDSNPALLDEGPLATREAASNHFDVFGAGEFPLAGGGPARTAIRGGLFLRQYQEDTGLDQSGVFAGLSHERRGAARRGVWLLDGGASYLDGEPFTRLASLGFDSLPLRGAQGWTLRGQLARFSTAEETFEYLDGWRLRADAEYGVRFGRAQVRTAYQFEFNDREDLQANGEFFSQSAVRHRIGVSLDHRIARAWSLQWTLRYRNSAWRDPDRFTDGTEARVESRVEQLTQAGVQLRYRIDTRSGVLLEHHYHDNRASIERYAYQRQLSSLGYEWSWGG